ncbi:MAG: hypothetical protein LBI86_09660 [Treponema sp.]|jgi:hypothetical protein|nr:hypothetical protein [Treponema sp.]
MDVTKSLNPNAMVLASAKIELSRSPVLIMTASPKGYQLTDLQDLGLARGVTITPSSSKIEIQADNGTVPIKGQTNQKVAVAFSLLERHLPILGKIMEGIVTVSAVPGASASFTDTYAAGVPQLGKLIPFSAFNHDGSAPSGVVFTQGSGGGTVTLEEDDDYTIVEYAGAYFFRLADGSYDGAKALKVVYEVTPAASYTMSRGGSGLAPNLAMKLTNRRQADDGRIISRTWELPYGFYNGDDVITLKSRNDSDNVAEVPMSFEFSPHPDMVSDADLEKMSLMREIQEV